jgi:hypothetical protein
MIRRMAIACLLLAVWTAPAQAEDMYFEIPVQELNITEGALPSPNQEMGRSFQWRMFESMSPAARLEGEGEAWITGNFDYWNWPLSFLENGKIHIRAPKGIDVTGELRVPRSDRTNPGQDRIRFTIPAKLATDEARAPFFKAQKSEFQRNLNRDLPGAAWWRHVLRTLPPGEKALAMLNTVGNLTAPARLAPDRSELGKTLELFSGTRALAENMQLDRIISPRGIGEEKVALETIEGLTIEEINWETLLPKKTPDPDPLAAYIPADQHGLFFATFKSLMTVMDEADAYGTPVLTLLSHSEDQGVKGRYKKQLCLPVSKVARILGPAVIRAVAMTGSDPFLRMGSDLAILFDSNQPGQVLKHVLKRQVAAAQGDATVVTDKGTRGGLEYEGVCNPTRTICSYAARYENLVVVSNSLAQLERIGKTATGETVNLASLPEYSFFRHRYPLGDDRETVFAIVSDAALRRWCNPRWRIADSRRIRFAAVLAELQVQNVQSVVAGKQSNGKFILPEGLPDVGPLEWVDGVIFSPTYGTLSFMTPIIELSMAEVTRAEADAYAWFRNRYQQDWRQFFDPIGARLFLEATELELDLSVMPLIASSDYREFIELTRGQTMGPFSGDPHEDVLARFGIALNASSRPIRQAATFANSMVPALGVNAMSWLGSHVVIYADKSKYWSEFATSAKHRDFLEKNFHRLPVALRVGVSSAMKVTAFLASVRAFIEQTAPGMTIWETQTHEGQAYVKVSPARRWDDDLPVDLAFFYAVTGTALTVTMDEELLKRALSRDAQRAKSKTASAETDRKGNPWLGEHAGLQGDAQVLELLEKAAREEVLPELQRRSWDNLPILNVWKKLFPDRNPVDVHESLWATRLTCPGGGRYAWNSDWKTMESTVYGHPGQPLAGPSVLRPPLNQLRSGNFGLTFEQDGVRAHFMLQRMQSPIGLFGPVFHNVCRDYASEVCDSVEELLEAMSSRSFRFNVQVASK